MPAATDRSAAPTKAHDGRNAASEAALRGALHAFARTPTLPPQPNLAASSSSSGGGKRPPARPATSSRLVNIAPQTNKDVLQQSGNTPGAVAAARSSSESSASPSYTTVPGSVDRIDGPAKVSHSSGFGNRPATLGTNIPSPITAEDGPIHAQGPAPDIHSPKPVRRVAAAASFEAAASESKTQPLKTDTSSDDGGVSLAHLPTEADMSSKPKPRSPSAQSDARQARRDVPSAPLVPMRSRSLSNVRRHATMASERSGRGTANTTTKKQPAQPRKVTPSTYQTSHDESVQRIDDLANAIVASHLASMSRGTSPSKSPGPIAPTLLRRQTDKPTHHFPRFNRTSLDSRTPSPAKKMRHTLRKHQSDEDEDEPQPRRPRGHFHLRQHPHKHHEGDRKRWRDEITLRERKRYEGVWAANRDIYMRYTAEELESQADLEDAKGSVSALVVKDVWSRSRLPDHALEEIWDLVDRKHVGRLDREEFVVGLWLVDQRLKGRKLPPKVGTSVWQSVRGIYGLKVPKKKE